MRTAAPIIRQRGEGQRMWFAGGGVFEWKATSAETGGAFLLIEDHLAPGKRTPMHLHPDEDEAIYVLEGELLVDMDGARHRVGAGGLLFAPRGLPHAFMVISDGARVLALQTPGTGEAFYREAGEPIEAGEPVRPPDWERLRAVADRSPSIEIIGPPPFTDADAELPAARGDGVPARRAGATS